MVKELKKQNESTRLKVSKEFHKIMNEFQQDYSQKLQDQNVELKEIKEHINVISLENRIKVAETQAKLEDT